MDQGTAYWGLFWNSSCSWWKTDLLWRVFKCSFPSPDSWVQVTAASSDGLLSLCHPCVDRLSYLGFSCMSAWSIWVWCTGQHSLTFWDVSLKNFKESNLLDLNLSLLVAQSLLHPSPPTPVKRKTKENRRKESGKRHWTLTCLLFTSNASTKFKEKQSYFIPKFSSHSWSYFLVSVNFVYWS